MNTIYLVIANMGDGSSCIEYYCDPASIKFLESLANEGDDRYASGDGLLVKELNIPTDLDYFASLNPGFYFFRR